MSNCPECGATDYGGAIQPHAFGCKSAPFKPNQKSDKCSYDGYCPIHHSNWPLPKDWAVASTKPDTTLRDEIETIIDLHADAVLEARDEGNTGTAVSLQEEADKEAIKAILSAVSDRLPREKLVNEYAQKSCEFNMPFNAHYDFHEKHGYNRALSEVRAIIGDN